MNRVSASVFVALTVGIAIALTASPARANQWDQRTYFTFSAPVAVPGVALPAGTYQFRLADTDGAHNIVQVLSEDGTKVYATFFAVPEARVTPSDKPVVTFEEGPAGAPELIKAWFYPDDATGHAFIYPAHVG
jgi:hypothetical protein